MTPESPQLWKANYGKSGWINFYIAFRYDEDGNDNMMITAWTNNDGEITMKGGGFFALDSIRIPRYHETGYHA